MLTDQIFESTSAEYDDLDEPGYSSSNSDGDSDRELQVRI